MELKFNVEKYLGQLSQYNALFNYVYKLGVPRFSTSIETACVGLIPNKNSKNDNDKFKIIFLINPDFFYTLTDEMQLFVLCHEALHLFFDHLNEIKDNDLNPIIANIAMDIVINEMLTKHFNFQRNEDLNNYCFIDTVFSQIEIKNKKIKQNKGFMYYYNLLVDKYNEEQNNPYHSKGISVEEFAKSLPQLMDEHLNDDVIEKIEKNNTDDETNENDNEINGNKQENNELKNNSDTEKEDDDSDGSNNYEKNGDGIKDNIDNEDENKNDSGNNSGGNGSDEKNDFEKLKKEFIEKILDNISKNENAKYRKIVDSFNDNLKNEIMDDNDFFEVYFKKGKIKKWKKILSKVKPKNYKLDKDELDSYLMQPNQFLFSLPDNVRMPELRETDVYKKNKILMYFFMDVSGSCLSYLKDFTGIIEEIPVSEELQFEAFTFDTIVYEYVLNNKDKNKKNKLHIGGGGTSFKMLENKIYEKLKNKDIFKYPDLIAVITDGYAPLIEINENQKSWIWIFTDEYYKVFHDHVLKQGCQVMYISDLK